MTGLGPDGRSAVDPDGLMEFSVVFTDRSLNHMSKKFQAVMRDISDIAREVYGSSYVEERHRHRYEVNNSYRGRLEEAGLVFSGTSPDGHLVEYVELPRDVHPYFVATQAHPEFRSRPARAHPLFAGLVAAAVARQDAGGSVDLTSVPAGTA